MIYCIIFFFFFVKLIYKVTSINKEVLCEKCVTTSPKSQGVKEPLVQQHNQHHQQQSAPKSPTESKHNTIHSGGIPSSPTKTTAATTDTHGVIEKSKTTDDYDPNECAGCNEQLREGQALIALDRQWHIWCFK